MMKRLMVVLSVFFCAFAQAQVNAGNDYFSTTVLHSYTSEDNAKDIINNIMAVVGLQAKFEIKEANIPNAAAVIYNGKRYILYNPRFVSKLNGLTGNQWASVSILAHEIGHHLNGHTLDRAGSTPSNELEADEFSGFVLEKMGATLSEAQAAMKIAAGQQASHTHPGQATRLVAIAKGWNNAATQNNDSNSALAKKYQMPEEAGPVVSQPVVRNESPVYTGTTIADAYISKDIYFLADRSASYYVTTRNNVVKLKNNQLSVIGKLASTDSREYPLVIYDDQKNYLLVNRMGSIVTASGKRVGIMKEHE